MELYVKYLLEDSVKTEFAAFNRGFQQVLCLPMFFNTKSQFSLALFCSWAKVNLYTSIVGMWRSCSSALPLWGAWIAYMWSPPFWLWCMPFFWHYQCEIVKWLFVEFISNFDFVGLREGHKIWRRIHKRQWHNQMVLGIGELVPFYLETS